MSQHPYDNLDLFFAERYQGGRSMRWHGFYRMHLPCTTGLRSPSLVRVTEVPLPPPEEEKEVSEDSVYWGWEDIETPGKFSMIWPSLVQLSICFPYGWKGSEESGKGRRVALHVTEVLNAEETRAAGLLEWKK
jgi:hypothetical protein